MAFEIVNFPSDAGCFDGREVVELISGYDNPPIDFDTRSTDFFFGHFCESQLTGISVWLFAPTEWRCIDKKICLKVLKMEIFWQGLDWRKLFQWN